MNEILNTPITNVNILISELAELIWETENIKKSAEKYGIPFSQIEKDIEILKNIFYEENVFLKEKNDELMLVQDIWGIQ